MIKVSITFYSPQEKLPKKSGYYLIANKNGHMANVEYSEKHKKFNASDDYDKSAFDVDFWAEIPEKIKLQHGSLIKKTLKTVIRARADKRGQRGK